MMLRLLQALAATQTSILPIRSLTGIRGNQRLQSTYTTSGSVALTYFPPGPKTAEQPNELVTPLLFISTEGSCQQVLDLAKRLALRRYSCLSAAFPTPRSINDATLKCYEKGLQSGLNEFGLTYPPVIISSGLGSIVAETYVSSNRASGLILIDPPPSVASLQSSYPNLSIPEFNYEPLFPIVMISTTSGLTSSALRNLHRFGESPEDVDWLEIRNGTDELEKRVTDWLDQMGM